MILKPTCTANGTWVLAPPPPQDAEWLRNHPTASGKIADSQKEQSNGSRSVDRKAR